MTARAQASGHGPPGRTPRGEPSVRPAPHTAVPRAEACVQASGSGDRVRVPRGSKAAGALETGGGTFCLERRPGWPRGVADGGAREPGRAHWAARREPAPVRPRAAGPNDGERG